MAKKLAMVLGVVFILVGILGFIPNPIVGEDGYFATDMLHNIVHLLSGIVLVIAAGKGAAARMSLIVVGVIYLVVTVLGFLMPSGGKILGLITINSADNYLHLALTAVLLLGGLMSKPSSSGMQSGMPGQM